MSIDNYLYAYFQMITLKKLKISTGKCVNHDFVDFISLNSK